MVEFVISPQSCLARTKFIVHVRLDLTRCSASFPNANFVDQSLKTSLVGSRMVANGEVNGACGICDGRGDIKRVDGDTVDIKAHSLSIVGSSDVLPLI